MPSFLLALVLLAQGPTASLHRPDTQPLTDPDRPVNEITRTSFSLQYATNAACETRVELREGGRLAIMAGAAPAYRVVSGPGQGLWHRIRITGLQPGRRYFYRLYDPGANPSASDRSWGSAAPWSREFAVSTQGAAGRKTIIHLPVKVLLMPNVIDAESSVQPDGSFAPDPTRVTAAQIALIEDEFRVASRFYWANSGMRLWVDFHFFVDDRWQRWGPEAPTASKFFQGLPMCRSYGGKPYLPPGGGTFTIVDTHDLSRVDAASASDGYDCQIEMAWPRRWDPVARTWSFLMSEAGTLGGDDLPKGVPARSQFLAGSDTAWLVASELHHQLESLGTFWLTNAENDRIPTDRPVPRHRYRRGDGTYDEQDWSTAGEHGEAWDMLRYRDSRVTDCQWLRMQFGKTETVADKDGDGFPDNDPRLPFDAKRFKAATGSASYAAACEWDWVRLPLQPSWIKDRTARPVPISNHPPLLRLHPKLDADVGAWAGIEPIGSIVGKVSVTLKEAYDEAAFYGLIVAKGSVSHIDVDLDGDERGMFDPPGPLGFSVVSLAPAAGQAGPVVLPVAVKPTFGGVQGRTPWLKWRANRKPDGTLVFQFEIPNGNESPWYWHGAGHRIGVGLNAYDTSGRGYSLAAPYRLIYATMQTAQGAEAAALPPAPLDVATETLKPGDRAFVLSPGWRLAEDASYQHEGPAAAITIGGQKAVDFDLIVDVDGSGSFAVAALAPLTPREEPNRDYVVTVDRGAAVLHVCGQAADARSMTAGAHEIELRRRGGGVWLLVDGKVLGYGLDKNSRVALNRFVVVAGDDAALSLRSVSYRQASAS